MHPMNQWTYVRPRCSGVRPKALLGRVLCGGKIFPPGHVKTEPVKRWTATFRDGEAHLSTVFYFLFFVYIDIYRTSKISHHSWIFNRCCESYIALTVFPQWAIFLDHGCLIWLYDWPWESMGIHGLDIHQTARLKQDHQHAQVPRVHPAEGEVWWSFNKLVAYLVRTWISEWSQNGP